MNYKNIVRKFLVDYIKNNFNIDTHLEDREDGYIINISKDEFVRVIHDESMGWHCFGDIKNTNFAYKVEEDLETFFDGINECDNDKSVLLNLYSTINIMPDKSLLATI